MSSETAYAILDRPEILQFIFYPRRDVSSGLPNSADYSVSVAEGVSIGCRFYVHSHEAPSILLFHGNGEVVSDYDGIAPIYNQQGINLFVADYRGYGASGGTPSFASMVSDAHTVFKAFQEILRRDHHTGNILMMGRSLGSIPAVELAFTYQEQMKGLIIESGFASILRLFAHLGFPPELIGIDDLAFPNTTKMQSITLPTLILHGEYDSLIPLDEARDLFENSAAEDKRLVVINRADHNTIILVGMTKYFDAIREFVLE